MHDETATDGRHFATIWVVLVVQKAPTR
jgi:hypothetical protein